MTSVWCINHYIINLKGSTSRILTAWMFSSWPAVRVSSRLAVSRSSFLPALACPATCRNKTHKVAAREHPRQNAKTLGRPMGKSSGSEQHPLNTLAVTFQATQKTGRTLHRFVGLETRERVQQCPATPSNKILDDNVS